MSARYRALYIRADTPSRIARIDADVRERQEYFDRMPSIDRGWVECGGAGESPAFGGRAIPLDASRRFGDVVYMGFQENVDTFVYAHCIDGQLVRHLESSADHGWTTVDGEPEPWEAEILFSGERREAMLEAARDFDDPAAQAAKVEEAFRIGRLVRGERMPWMWADALFHAVRRHLG